MPSVSSHSFWQKNLPTFLAEKNDEKNTWWLPNVLKGCWVQTHLATARRFLAQIFGIETLNSRHAFFHKDIGCKDV